jgi:hypothetical protein|tara:strand:+ start:1688 stop:2110 length:423 start_codon:yes stop_codon:yes gene_type:complete
MSNPASPNGNPGPLFIDINNSGIVKGNNGEPDAVLYRSPYMQSLKSKKQGAFISIPKEFSITVLISCGSSSFIVWLAIFDAYRIRKKQPFKLNSKITSAWSINRKRLGAYLLKLQEHGFIEYELGCGKAPTITKVHGYQN